MYKQTKKQKNKNTKRKAYKQTHSKIETRRYTQRMKKNEQWMKEMPRNVTKIDLFDVEGKIWQKTLNIKLWHISQKQ